MIALASDFAIVRNIKIDPSTPCTCCNCGHEVPFHQAYSDTIDRFWCPECAEGSRIFTRYEIAMHELTRLLDRLDIPYEEVTDLFGGKQVRFPWHGGDVVCHMGSYGGAMGRLETMGFTSDNGDVTGFLLPMEALEIILHDWNERNRKMQKGE